MKVNTYYEKINNNETSSGFRKKQSKPILLFLLDLYIYTFFLAGIGK
jgi:hypothetical protein